MMGVSAFAVNPSTHWMNDPGWIGRPAPRTLDA